MFQVVKVLGDFNNTIYLLSFDKSVVVKSLKDVQGGDGDDYLKIKAFLMCEGKETNSEGICKINYDKDLKRMSFGAFFGWFSKI